MYEPIELIDDSPAELLRATQAVADALEDMIAEAPDQWYTFKRMWPATEAEAQALEAQALAAQALAADTVTATEVKETAGA